MKEQLKLRLIDLKEEFQNGKNMLGDLESRQTNLKETLLRIAGAIEVLEEELNKVSSQDENDNVEKLVNKVN